MIMVQCHSGAPHAQVQRETRLMHMHDSIFNTLFGTATAKNNTFFHTQNRRTRLVKFSPLWPCRRGQNRPLAQHCHPWPRTCVVCLHTQAVTHDGHQVLYGLCVMGDVKPAPPHSGHEESLQRELLVPHALFFTIVQLDHFTNPIRSVSTTKSMCIAPATRHNTRVRVTGLTSLVPAHENPPTFCCHPASSPSR